MGLRGPLRTGLNFDLVVRRRIKKRARLKPHRRPVPQVQNSLPGKAKVPARRRLRPKVKTLLRGKMERRRLGRRRRDHDRGAKLDCPGGGAASEASRCLRVTDRRRDEHKLDRPFLKRDRDLRLLERGCGECLTAEVQCLGIYSVCTHAELAIWTPAFAGVT